MRNNADLITFCRCTGLRRAELQALRYDDFRLAAPDGSAGPGLYVHRSTKGGRVRRINFVGSKAEIALCCDIMSKGSGLSKVWGKVHSAADIHSYRADYATLGVSPNKICSLYTQNAYLAISLTAYISRIWDIVP